MTRCQLAKDQEDQRDEAARSDATPKGGRSPEPHAALKLAGPQGVSAELSVHGRLSTRLLAMSVPLFCLGMLAYLLMPSD